MYCTRSHSWCMSLFQPKLVGDSVGLKPLLTLVLLYIGYRVGSVLGNDRGLLVGMIVINLYKAGAFDYILDDVKILAEGVLSCGRFVNKL